MIIPIGLPQVFSLDSSWDENAEVLEATLEYLIFVNRIFLRRQPFTPRLYESGVVYGRTVVWDSIPAVMERRFGDCKSLTAWQIAERREQGLSARPVFRWIPETLQYHILVLTPNGFEDPSKYLGMGQAENGPIQGY
jgi:hypothetical protein